MGWRVNRPYPVLREATGALRLERVTKCFGDVVAVDAVTLDVPKGGFFALLGPSGCGKTTTLRMIAGLEQPDAGRVLIGNTDVSGSRPYERPVNTVFQSYALFPHLNVLDNVAFGPRRRHVPDAVRRARATLDLVHMGEYATRRPAELSGGQQQRVALARALVNEPEVLLLDEPLGALDLKLRREMQVELGRLHDALGTTFVHVTHDQEEAMTMADQVALMNRGRIEQLGSPAELYDRPRSVFAANFLGTSNLASGRVVASGETDLDVEVAAAVIAVPRLRSTTTQGTVVVGVRPEKLVLAGTHDAARAALGVGDHANVLGPGRVSHVSFSGVSTEYRVELPGLGEWAVFAQNLAVTQLFRTGDRVVVAWDRRHTFGLPPLSADEYLDEGTATDEADLPLLERLGPVS